MHRILTDPDARAAIDEIVAWCATRIRRNQHRLRERGREGPRRADVVRVGTWATGCTRLGKRLAVEVSAKYEHTTTGGPGFYDYAALARGGHVFVMNWGWHWETSEPGAPDDIELCRKVADYVASMPNR